METEDSKEVNIKKRPHPDSIEHRDSLDEKFSPKAIATCDDSLNSESGLLILDEICPTRLLNDEDPKSSLTSVRSGEKIGHGKSKKVISNDNFDDNNDDDNDDELSVLAEYSNYVIQPAKRSRAPPPKTSRYLIELHNRKMKRDKKKTASKVSRKKKVVVVSAVESGGENSESVPLLERSELETQLVTHLSTGSTDITHISPGTGMEPLPSMEVFDGYASSTIGLSEVGSSTGGSGCLEANANSCDTSSHVSVMNVVDSPSKNGDSIYTTIGAVEISQ